MLRKARQTLGKAAPCGLAGIALRAIGQLAQAAVIQIIKRQRISAMRQLWQRIRQQRRPQWAGPEFRRETRQQGCSLAACPRRQHRQIPPRQGRGASNRSAEASIDSAKGARPAAGSQKIRS